MRAEAGAALRSRISTGVLLVVIGFLTSVVTSVAAAGEESIDTATVLFTAAGYGLVLVGSALVLVGIVGHGVRLGIEASRVDRAD